jgi:hypothetical protein
LFCCYHLPFPLLRFSSALASCSLQAAAGSTREGSCSCMPDTTFQQAAKAASAGCCSACQLHLLLASLRVLQGATMWRQQFSGRQQLRVDGVACRHIGMASASITDSHSIPSSLQERPACTSNRQQLAGKACRNRPHASLPGISLQERLAGTACSALEEADKAVTGR